ncbi:hypothetical protein EBZ70_02635 [bacterium]|jgi:hypothetical protein|nr:hypothetical protein [bacterium]
MPRHRKTSRRPSSATLLRPWLVVAGTGLVLGALLLLLDSSESTHPFIDFGARATLAEAESFRPTEAMITRAETEFQDAFTDPASVPRLTLPPISATVKTPESAR